MNLQASTTATKIGLSSGSGHAPYDVTAIPTAASAPVPSHVKLGNDFNHAILIGLRYNFAPPPPPPPPVQTEAPAPAPSRS